MQQIFEHGYRVNDITRVNCELLSLVQVHWTPVHVSVTFGELDEMHAYSREVELEGSDRRRSETSLSHHSVSGSRIRWSNILVHVTNSWLLKRKQ